MKKTIRDLENIKNKKVIVRVDYNVPIENGKVNDDNRLIKTFETIDFLLKKETKIILLSHLGRVNSEEDKLKNSLEPVFNRLKELRSDWKIKFIDATSGKKVEQAIKDLKNGEILLLQNTRFEDIEGKKESKNNPVLGKYWAKLGDIFVNDAFGTAHRAHASNVGIATYISENALGFLIEKEVKYLGEALDNPRRPFVALLGGAKVSDKIEIIESLTKKADKVIIGTAMCNTFNLAKGYTIGKSLAEPRKVDLAKKLLEENSDKLYIASDYYCTRDFDNDAEVKYFDKDITENWSTMDIGPKTLEMVRENLKGAKTVIWNGPFGVTEFSNFAKGSEEIAKILVSLEDATTIIGGGDSAAMAIRMGLEDKLTHISTGGGSSMEFLEGKILPGIECIEDL